MNTQAKNKVELKAKFIVNDKQESIDNLATGTHFTIWKSGLRPNTNDPMIFVKTSSIQCQDIECPNTGKKDIQKFLSLHSGTKGYLVYPVTVILVPQN